MLMGGVAIGDRVEIGPGLLINHGHVVIDGATVIGPLCSVAPFATIGLDTGGPEANFAGPTIGRFAFIGTGAKVLGGITIGRSGQQSNEVKSNAAAVTRCRAGVFRP